MKKIIFAGAFLFGAMSLVACDNADRSGSTEREGTVVERDSVATEYEVTETTVEYDTTRKTKTVDVDRDRKDRDNR